MTALTWHKDSDKMFDSGLDRGVIYPEDGTPVAWSGLISVEDSGEQTIREFFIDGVKYLAVVSPRDWKGAVEAYTFPDAFSDLLGIAEVGDGLFLDSQRPKRFGLSYRTLLGDGTNKQHYRIHFVYNALAALNGFTHKSLTSGGVDPTAFKFDLTAVPERVAGHRPTAHFMVDSRKVDPVTLATLEGQIYGNGYYEPRLPTPTELVNMLKFGDGVRVVDNLDGTWTATGANRNVSATEDGFFTLTSPKITVLDSKTFRIDDVVIATP